MPGRVLLVASLVVPGVHAQSSPETITAEQVDALLAAGQLDEGEKLARARLAQVEAAAGPDSDAAADGARKVVEALYYLGRGAEPEAVALAARVVGIRRKVHGDESSQVADALSDLAIMEQEAGRLDDARRHAEEALAMGKRTLGPTAPMVGTLLNNVAGVRFAAGDAAGARDAYGEALEILRASKDADPASIAVATMNFAAATNTAGDAAGAVRLYESALPINRAAFGDEHPQVATCLNNLGNALKESGDLERARAIHEAALAMRRKVLGPDHPHVATSLSNLALTLMELGDLPAARRLLEEALDLARRTVGPDHRETLNALANLGALAWEQGDHAGARPVLEQSLALSEKILGPDSPVTIARVHDLGSFLREAGDLTAARPLLERGLEGRRRVLGPSHPDVVASLNNLALLVAAQGDLPAARALFEQARTILVETPGTSPSELASVTLNLGMQAADEGDLRRALTLCDEAVAQSKRALGPDHHSLIGSEAHVATLRAAGDAEGALSAALDSQRIAREHLRVAAAALSEREALRYARRYAGGLSIAVSVLCARQDPAAVTDTWSELVRSRGLVADVMAERAGLAREPALEPLALARAKAARWLAQIVAAGPGTSSGAAHAERVAQARAELEAAERELGRGMPSRTHAGGGASSLADVAATLGDGEALLAYARFDRWGVALPGAPAVTKLESEPWYVAFVLPSAGGTAVAVPLATEETLRQRVAAWRQAASSPDSDARDSGRALREVAWDPVAGLLAHAKRVNVVPDGVLFGVPLGALPDEQGGYLVESAPLACYLSAERDLAESASAAKPGLGLLALGGPAFDATPWRPAPAGTLWRAMASSAKLAFDAVALRGATSSCDAFTGLRFQALPGSEQEVHGLARAWRSSVATSGQSRRVTELVRDEATEDALVRLAPSHRFVHVATHGFFLAGDCEPPQRSGVAPEPGGASEVLGEVTVRGLAESPLLRSGLALAGFNRRADAPAGGADGVLTAEEVSSLDLAGVEWLVLSACDTGLGDVAAGEGVLGLQRAFRIAGARTLIMSLWAVPDRETRAWMTDLYDAHLARGLDAAASVRAASLATLRRRREAGLSDQPYAWAAFVATGATR